MSLEGWTRDGLGELFDRVDHFEAKKQPSVEGAAALFFPPSSLRTRVSFERGVFEMGLQPITFPPETLDKSENLADVAGYLSAWVRLMVVRHSDISVLQRLADADVLPVINAMTDVNHPCEVLSDLYALSQEADIFSLRFLFVGADGNIARAWQEAAKAFGLSIVQSCPAELRVPGMPWQGNLMTAIADADVVITDGPGPHAEALTSYRVTAAVLEAAPSGIRFAPCPPFIRGREVSTDAIEHPAFVGYSFKQYLKPVQQAVMSWALGE
ncbi:ornithine carbamoyltransferase [Corynebacterium suranareeae]|uniref:Ornithine carbamoyltransferase n=1 Tax=Corynebacterium suranareeae TaxID=2506452 RepID=A0A160PNJ0_9CORY|nr:ornithine carbamoyltransferase [Corynebacterium suranareeae]BAU95409.1 ornithine carbamoyltransferase [Corynebacterium suranareeae]